MGFFSRAEKLLKKKSLAGVNKLISKFLEEFIFLTIDLNLLSSSIIGSILDIDI
jgi:hypothetical protein